MCLWKVDNVSSEEWHRRQMRRHSIERWLITLGEIALMVVTIGWVIYVLGEIKP